MAKGILNISNYSGGLNNKTNSRDIEDSQFQDLDSLSIETPGKLKIMGAAGDYNPPATTGNLNTEVNLGNGLFHFNADHDIDNTNGTVVNTEMLFLNTDVTAEGVLVFNLNSGALAYGTLTIPYGNTFSPVIYSAVDGIVRIVPTSFATGNTPKKLQYVKEKFTLGYEKTTTLTNPQETQLNNAEDNYTDTITKWKVSNMKPADVTDSNIKVYLAGPNPVKTGDVAVGAFSALINADATGITPLTGAPGPSPLTSASNVLGHANGLYINCSTADAAKAAAGDIILISEQSKTSEFVKVVSNNTTDGWIKVERAFYGTSANGTFSASASLKFVYGNNFGQILKMPYTSFTPSLGTAWPALDTDASYKGKFNVNFYLGEVKDDLTLDADTGQFFSSDDNNVNIFSEIVYLDRQRSNLKYEGTVNNTTNGTNNIPLFAQMWGKLPSDSTVQSIKFYYNETASNVSDGISDIDEAIRNVKYLLFEIDFRKGLRFPKSEEYRPMALRYHASYDTQGVFTFPVEGLDGLALELHNHINISSIKFKNKPETVIAESYVEQNKHVMGIAGTGYKASTIANRRMYIGNVAYADEVTGEIKTLNDTIFKSNLNAFDTFSFENRIDVEINDGDDIIALEALGSKLLEFKRNHLYILNVARDIEFLEATLEYKGCEKDYHVLRGEGFIAWFNKFGFYLYDGKQVRDLLLDKKGQQRLVWSDYYHENNIIGYDPDEKTIIITKGKNVQNSTEYNTQTVIAFDMKAFSLYVRSKGFELEATTNFITNNAGDILWFSKYSGTNVELRKWNTSPSKLDSSNIDEMALKTKEFTFGKPSVDKKIISVYLSYKNGDGVELYGFRNDGEEELLAALDGNSETNFKTLHISIRKAKTEFVDKKRFDRIKGFGLRFSGSDVATNFEINDIQVIFREKSVK